MDSKNPTTYDHLIERCRAITPAPTVVVHPCDETSLMGAVEAAGLGIITPTLVGPRRKIEAVAEKAGADISGFRLVDVAHSHAAAARGVQAGTAQEAAR